MNHRPWTLAVVSLLMITGVRAASAVGPDPWTWPLEGHDVDRQFDPPTSDYGPGHRGVDLPATVGDVVRTVAPGRVTFAGDVAGTPVVTVDHGGERSTYQPVKARVAVGDAVAAGDVIGTLLGMRSHCTGACLHLGRRAGETYLDPLDLLVDGRFQLIDPAGSPPTPPDIGDGTLQRPVGGPVTSPFGMRVHPVTGERTLHDGTDFGVPCGTPVHAAGDGVVVGLPTSPVYGKRVIVRHVPGLTASYNHLTSQSAAVGQRVSAGDVIGRVGSTGLSTGCHLHFMVDKGGPPLDPQLFL